MKKFVNIKRVWGLTLKKKNKVYFLRGISNIKIIFIQTTRPSDKLDFTKLKLFKILKVLGLIIYKLDLPDSMKITRIRHVSVLKLVDLEAPLIKNIPDIDPESQEKVWEIKEIINSGLINNNKRKYLIK